MSRLFEFDRRDMLRTSFAGAFGVSCSGWLPRVARAAETEGGKAPQACILLWMSGGPAQTDTFDPKPEHENGGPTKTIETAVPGIRIAESLPGVAKQMKDLAIIRGMSTTEGDHGRGTYTMRTGFRMGGPLDYPVIGSIVAKELGHEDHELPNYVSISSFRFGQGGGAGFLGPRFGPLTVTGDSADPTARANLSIENLRPPSHVDDGSRDNRFALLDTIQKDFNERYATASAEAHKANVERAMRMVKSEAKQAFRLDQETAELRDAYGRNRFGQGCLLARRLVERGVPFVEVTLSGIDGGFGWDTHGDNFNRVNTLCETLDPAWSTLMTDLRDRGMLDDTLVVWMGEFGRTPNINDNRGRDHFPRAWSTVVGGAGIKGGQVWGDTGKDGMEVVKDPVKVPQFLATVCSAVGIDPETENYSPEGRPIKVVDEGGAPIEGLLAKSTV